MVKLSNKISAQKISKKWDSSKFWSKNQDCPSKSGTVGRYDVGITNALIYHYEVHYGKVWYKVLAYTLVEEKPSITS